MVSTRGVRYKFSEGERVLCYEPDPTKAKVLYDSKVLEVIESKDKRGRRTVEYLIHFQGWNSSWDRCVSEDFVLKDTEENRQLQRDLAEKSQLQLGAYLYRRERKKGSSSSAGTAPAKRGRQGFSDDGSSSSTQPDEGNTEGETEPLGPAAGEGDGEASADTDSSSGSAGEGSLPNSPPHNMQTNRANITLPSALRDRLTFDYHLVVKRGRVSRLPAVPCAAHILESFVKWFVRAGAWSPRARHDAAPPARPDLLDVACRLNLVREVADGLRVYFDFVLRGHLLYKQELPQYHEICGQFVEQHEKKCKEEYSEVEQSQHSSSEEEDLKSPKIPEYSHLPPDPTTTSKEQPGTPETSNEQTIEIKQEVKEEADEEFHDDTKPGVDEHEEKPTKEEPKVEIKEEMKEEVEERAEEEPHVGSEVKREGRPATRSGTTVARRLRSHKSIVSQSESEEPTPAAALSTAAVPAPATASDTTPTATATATAPATAPATEPKAFENMSSSVGSSGSSLSEGCARAPAPAAPPAPPATTRTPLSLLLEKVAKWQIIPREGTEHLPCRVYGAIHLARLFVKLPDFLNATQMPDLKLKLIVKHIDMFVQYLEEHSEWFGETYYVADNLSRGT